MSMTRYQEILYLPHHRSERHLPMSHDRRAAQFAPFDALEGYGDAVRETGSFKEQRRQIAEDREEELNRVISDLRLLLPKQPGVRLTDFREDPGGTGGHYRTRRLRVTGMDLSGRILFLEGGEEVALEDIIFMEIEEKSIQRDRNHSE